MTREDLLALVQPVAARVATLDAGDPTGCVAALAAVDIAALTAGLAGALGEGWLTPREGGGVRFGRLARPTPETYGLSVDVVDMDGPASGPHVHPRGEFDLCVPISGDPRFDGHAGPWVVYPPGSRHVPTVRGGRMVIVYFLPGGEIRFE